MKIQPLKSNWEIKDGYSDHFFSRVQSEDNFTWAKGYDLIKKTDGKPDPLCPRAIRNK